MEEIHIQMEDNSPSIEHTLRPITYTSWFLGVGIPHPRKCHKSVTIILRIIHLVLCSINALHSMTNSYIDSIVINFKSDIYEFIFYINLVITYVSTYYYICQGIRQYDKWPELMDKIEKFDQKIRREIPINDKPVKNVEALAILATLTCCLLWLIMYFLYYFYINPFVMFESDSVFYFIPFQSLINSFVFDVVIYVLYYRLQAINKLIGQLDELSDALGIALKIRCIQEMHNGIYDLIMMVNDIYGFYLLICSVNCLTMVVSELFAIYVEIAMGDNSFMLIHIILSILYTMQFGLMCWICMLVRQEFDKTGIIICAIVLNFKHVNHKLKGRKSQSNLEMRISVEGLNSGQNSIWNSSHYLNNVTKENLCKMNHDCIRNEINDFLIQLQHQRVVFTACGFFEINNVVCTGFIGVIIVYLTICIQFYKESDADFIQKEERRRK